MHIGKILKARTCYGHLGGTLGNRLFSRLMELKWFEADEEKTTVYKITPKGIKELESLGVDIYFKK
jgi:predicted transcriptional regulator